MKLYDECLIFILTKNTYTDDLPYTIQNDIFVLRNLYQIKRQYAEKTEILLFLHIVILFDINFSVQKYHFELWMGDHLCMHSSWEKKSSTHHKVSSLPCSAQFYKYCVLYSLLETMMQFIWCAQLAWFECTASCWGLVIVNIITK